VLLSLQDVYEGVPGGLAGELAVGVLAVLPLAAPAHGILCPPPRVPVLARPPRSRPRGPQCSPLV
jgi:hypothetical protein